jgi:hypothetical protein
MGNADHSPPLNAPTSRRRFLSTAAGVAAGGGVLALATIPPAPALAAPGRARHGILSPIEADPAFALIAEKLAADVAHLHTIEAQDEAEVRTGSYSGATWEARERCADACDVVNEADWTLATTPPTTLAGIAAVLRFANQIEDEGNDWPDTDTIGPDGWHYQLRATMAAAIEALIEASAEKAVAS